MRSTLRSSGQMMRMDYYKSFLKPVKSVHEAQTGNLSVPVFAVHSGGLVFNATGDLAAFINNCVAEAKAYYTIGFDPAGAEHTDEYHALDVDSGQARAQGADEYRILRRAASEARRAHAGPARSRVIYAECLRWHASLPHWCSYRW